MGVGQPEASEVIEAALAGTPHTGCAAPRWVIAFSGGLDSSVLLHGAVRVFGASSVVAVHVHHGLQAVADEWPAHCLAQASALGAQFECVRLSGPPPRGVNVEAWAREHRYRALAQVARRVGASAVLTAHHQDDQFETVLMRMARGTGIDGLGGIEPRIELAGCEVLRPLLSLPRSALRAFALAHALAWVEDPTNADGKRTRNVVRHVVLPQLEACEPGFRRQLAASVERARALRQTRREQAMQDLARAGAVRPGETVGAGSDAFDRRSLALLPARRCDLALREWIRSLGLRAPTAARLREMRRQLVEGSGAHGRVLHEGHWLVRDRDRVRTVDEPMLAEDSGECCAPPLALRWTGEPVLELPRWRGRLQFIDAAGDEPGAVSAHWLRAQTLTLTDGGASSRRLRPAPRAYRRTLKNLYQERGIAAWQRARLPLVFAQQRLLFAAGVGMDCDEAWPRDGKCVRLYWMPGGV